ncbi:MAG: MBL fold metallo-hydrolase [Candidatus Kapabacteria bacterium]|nr:MBL fold metallo-hydrolase [Candidatus Kapabacteria bacterium]
MIELSILGGAGEIGANCCYLNMDGIGMVIDAGLHPRKSDRTAFPATHLLGNRSIEALLLTHAHTDHTGGIPFLFRTHPFRRTIATRPTRDLTAIMMRDNIKLIRKEHFEGIERDEMSMYSTDFLDFFTMACEGYLYGEDITVDSLHSSSAVNVKFFDAGHILGSAGILAECNGRSVFHTGDVNFRKQQLIPAAAFPKHHVDVLICESTNGATEDLPDYRTETKRLTAFINEITTNNGSVLIPAFSCGRTQEILTLLYQLMRKGSIPTLPVYSGGMARHISRIYDVHTYSVPRVQPGFEMTDIPQQQIAYDHLTTDRYMKEPSIVVTASGMMDEGTTSYRLAREWMKHQSFGIAFSGYADPTSPGYALLHSEPNKDFLFGGRKARRSCRTGQFRFSAHADRDSIVDFITTMKPKHLFLIHGELDASGWIGARIRDELPQTKVYLPTLGKIYRIEE